VGEDQGRRPGQPCGVPHPDDEKKIVGAKVTAICQVTGDGFCRSRWILSIIGQGSERSLASAGAATATDGARRLP
jgi:hypothetical protein